MGCWGKGLLQSDDDYEIARDLSDMLGCELLFVDKQEDTRISVVAKLDSGVLSQKFDKILSADFQPRTTHHKRERMAVILGMLAMEVGAKIEDRHLTALRVLRPWLPTIEQQLQLVVALDEYKNDGTPVCSTSGMSRGLRLSSRACLGAILELLLLAHAPTPQNSYLKEQILTRVLTVGDGKQRSYRHPENGSPREVSV